MADAGKGKPPTPNPPTPPPQQAPGNTILAEISYVAKKKRDATSLYATVDWKAPADIHLTTGAPGGQCQVTLTDRQRQLLDEAFQNASDVLADAAVTVRDFMPF